MASKNFKTGLDNVFSSTLEEPVKEVTITTEATETIELIQSKEMIKPVETPEMGKKRDADAGWSNYNIRYPKDLQRRMKIFCAQHDEIDMKMVFIEGAKLYMSQYRD